MNRRLFFFIHLHLLLSLNLYLRLNFRISVTAPAIIESPTVQSDTRETIAIPFTSFFIAQNNFSFNLIAFLFFFFNFCHKQ